MAKELATWKLLTPKRRYSAIGLLQRRFGVSERKACAVTGQSLPTQRLSPPLPPSDDGALTL
jgi:hypothetical protein